MDRVSVIPRVAARRAAGRWLSEATDRLLVWLDRARQRRALLSLDDRMLKDVGLSRADVESEADKPFWRS